MFTGRANTELEHLNNLADEISQISFTCVRADKLAYYARAVTI